MGARLLVFAAAHGLVGALCCGGLSSSPPTPGRIGEAAWSGPVDPWLRVDLREEAGELSIVRVQRVDWPAGAHPSMLRTGTHVVAAMSGDRLVSGALVGLPDVAVVERGLPSAMSGEVMPLESARESVFLRDEGADRVRLLDANGVELAAEAVAAPAVAAKGDLLGGLGACPDPTRWMDLDDGTRIWLLEPGMECRLSSSRVAAIEEPDAARLSQVAAALALASPRVRASVRTLGIVRFQRSADVWGETAGTTVLIAADRFVGDAAKGVPATVVHEAAHAYLNTFRPRRGSTVIYNVVNWEPGLSDLVQKNIAQYSLGQSLDRVWTRMHNTGVYAGLIGAFDGRPKAKPLENGSATAYGSSDPLEDIPEIATWVQLPSPDGPGTPNPFCSTLRAAISGTPLYLDQRQLISYMKVNLLEDLGFVTPAAVTTCIGPASARIDTRFDSQLRPALHLFKDNSIALPTSFWPPSTGDAAGWGNNASFAEAAQWDAPDVGSPGWALKLRGTAGTLARDEESVYSGPWNVVVDIADQDENPRGIYNFDRDWNWWLALRGADPANAGTFVQFERPTPKLFMQTRNGRIAITQATMRDGVLCELRGLLLPSETGASGTPGTGAGIYFEADGHASHAPPGTKFFWGLLHAVNAGGCPADP